LYLAHLNPVTNAHVEIISDLQGRADSVKVVPVVFRDGGREINSRSFPFSFETRREMLESVFGNSVVITDDYTFHAPLCRYMPPLLSPLSWSLRMIILRGVDRDFFSYTGDRTEGYMLRMYMLKPKVGTRKPLSAASVKERIYEAAMSDGVAGGTPNTEEEEEKVKVKKEARADGKSAKNTGDGLWSSSVPDSVARIIRREWDTVRRFADAEDATTRILGMKFPKST